MQQRPQSPGVPPVLRAILVALMWQPLAVTLAMLAAAGGGRLHPGPLAVGFALTTFLLVGWERRVAQRRGEATLRLGRTPAGLAAAAFVAGTGMMILASEVGNITLELAPPGSIEVGDPLTHRWMWALFEVLVHPICATLIYLGVVLRILLPRVRRPWVVLGAVALWTPISQSIPWPIWPQVGLPMLLAGWLWQHSRSLPLAWLSLLPQHLAQLPWIYERSIGVAGFDPDLSTPGVFQPIWFDLLGALLLAVGVGLAMRAFGFGDRPRAVPRRR